MAESRRVLVIEDEKAVAEVVSDVLQCFGYDVAVATSGKEGLRTACTSLPDAVVCDVRMPEIGGEEVMLALKAQPTTAKIPVVLVSGYCEPSFAHLADAFLQKPFSMEELSGLLANLLSTRQGLAN